MFVFWVVGEKSHMVFLVGDSYFYFSAILAILIWFYTYSHLCSEKKSSSLIMTARRNNWNRWIILSQTWFSMVHSLVQVRLQWHKTRSTTSIAMYLSIVYCLWHFKSLKTFLESSLTLKKKAKHFCQNFPKLFIYFDSHGCLGFCLFI